jgi:glycosyltransferase involved in cell wall biosynthesis
MRKKICLIAGSMNEGNGLKNFFEQHRWVDEIIILDSGSTDDTNDICAKYNRKFLKYSANGNFNERFGWGITQTQADWVFIIDLDEIISAELKEEVEKVLESDDDVYQAYEFMRVNFFMDRPLNHGGWSNYSLKIFKRGSVSFKGNYYHERPIVDGRIGRLKGTVMHYASPNIHWVIEKFNYISEFDLKVYHERFGILSQKDFKWLLLTKPLKNFWKCYVKKQGYKDGLHGFIYAALIWAQDVIRICKYGEKFIIKNPNLLSQDKLPDPWECRKR